MENVEKTFVLQNILRKKRQSAKETEDKAKAKILSKKINSSKKIHKEKIVLPEFFINKYKANQTSYQRLRKRKNQLQKLGTLPEDKTMILIRIRGNKKLSPKVLNILKSLHLSEINSAVFVKTTTEISEKIKLIEPYITYGYPSRKTVSELIYKKGFANINGKRVPINNNELIEKELGDSGLLCIEDLVHEIIKTTDKFEKLTNPKQDNILKTPKKPFSTGGDWGNRKEKINELLSHMI